MATPGVGVLIDPDRLKDPAKQATPYFIQVDGNRYYGKTPESAIKEAKKTFKSESSTNIIPRKAKKQKQTSVTDPMAEDLKLLGLSPGATESEIKAASKKAFLNGHSNKGGTANIGALTAARDRLLSRLKPTPPAVKPAAAEPAAILDTNAKGGGKTRKSLKRKRTFRKKRSATRKHLK